MFWDTVRAAFEDELEKIAEFSLRGLNPQTALTAATPPSPLETQGYDKAKAVLDRVDAAKTAAANLQFTGRAAQQVKKEEGSKPVQDVKSLGAHTLGGAGAGRLISEMAHGPKLPDATKFHSSKWYGTAIGAGVGAAEFARRRSEERRVGKECRL